MFSRRGGKCLYFLLLTGTTKRLSPTHTLDDKGTDQVFDYSANEGCVVTPFGVIVVLRVNRLNG